MRQSNGIIFLVSIIAIALFIPLTIADYNGVNYGGYNPNPSAPTSINITNYNNITIVNVTQILNETNNITYQTNVTNNITITNNITTVYNVTNNITNNITVNNNLTNIAFVNISNFFQTNQTFNASIFADNICYSNGTNAYTRNATYESYAYNQTSTSNGNESWNQSYAEQLFASIIWGNNQTSLGQLPYLFSIGTQIYLNETYLNNTVKSLAQVKAYNYTVSVSTSGGTGYVSTPVLSGFEVTRLTVTPNSNSTAYRFYTNLTSGGDVVDQNRMVHYGVWSIRKNQAVNNDSLTYTLSSVSPDDTFTITSEYINNFGP